MNMLVPLRKGCTASTYYRRHLLRCLVAKRSCFNDALDYIQTARCREAGSYKRCVRVLDQASNGLIKKELHHCSVSDHISEGRISFFLTIAEIRRVGSCIRCHAYIMPDVECLGRDYEKSYVVMHMDSHP